jgi:hypothetical protein
MYVELKTWMRVHYAALCRPLRPCWADHSVQFQRDPFESLLSFDRLEDLLSANSSIDDMMLCRRALDDYRRSLGQSAC